MGAAGAVDLLGVVPCEARAQSQGDRSSRGGSPRCYSLQPAAITGSRGGSQRHGATYVGAAGWTVQQVYEHRAARRELPRLLLLLMY
jgi:hypothetical protein